MNRYIEIKEESDGVFLNGECKKLFISIEKFRNKELAFPLYINITGSDWFSKEDIEDSGLANVILEECDNDIKNSISIKEYATRRLKNVCDSK